MKHTKNIDIEKARLETAGKLDQTYHHHTNLQEINAFIDLLYFSAITKTHNVN